MFGIFLPLTSLVTPLARGDGAAPDGGEAGGAACGVPGAVWRAEEVGSVSSPSLDLTGLEKNCVIFVLHASTKEVQLTVNFTDYLLTLLPLCSSGSSVSPPFHIPMMEGWLISAATPSSCWARARSGCGWPSPVSVLLRLTPAAGTQLGVDWNLAEGWLAADWKGMV